MLSIDPYFSIFCMTLSTNPRNTMFTILNYDTIKLIISYLNAKGLCILSQCSNRSNKLYSILYEDHWNVLCIRRWNIDEKTKKILGVYTMKSVYETLSKRNKIPRGKYTLPHHYIFSSSNQFGISCWMLLDHNHDARLIRKTYNNDIYNSIKVRICIQNIYHCLIKLDLNDKNNPKFHNLLNETILIKDSYVISKNGMDYNDIDNKILLLSSLEFCVITCEVLCSRNIIYETDFLAMIQYFSIKMDSSINKNINTSMLMNEKNNISNNNEINNQNRLLFIDNNNSFIIEIKSKILDEDDIWMYYSEIPGMGVILRDKPYNSI